jgi:hypothetical protein
MYDGIDVWREDWRAYVVWSFKMGAPCGPVRRGLVSIPGSFKQILLSSYHRVLAFLTETASHSESSVNHSKQTSAPFLSGARIVKCVLYAATLFAAFLTQIAIHAASSPLNSSSLKSRVIFSRINA